MKTNDGLVNYAKRALDEGWGYMLGGYGQTLTHALLNQKMAQGDGVGMYNTKWKDYLLKFIGKRVLDCYGIVKGYCWTETSVNGVIFNEPKYASNGMPDRNQETAYQAAKEKGPLSTMPEIPGLILWMPGHAGVYVGGGDFIECVGAPVGMRCGTIKGGVVTSGSKFTHWFKDTAITYQTQAQVTPEEITVDNAISDGIITDKLHWMNVLTGKSNAVPAYIKIFMDRSHQLIKEGKK